MAAPARAPQKTVRQGRARAEAPCSRVLCMSFLPELADCVRAFPMVQAGGSPPHAGGGVGCPHPRRESGVAWWVREEQRWCSSGGAYIGECEVG